MGKYLLLAGLILIIAGAAVWFLENKAGGWFGNLPGDIRIVKDNFRFYAPLTSMLLISIVISLLIWLIRKIF